MRRRDDARPKTRAGLLISEICIVLILFGIFLLIWL